MADVQRLCPYPRRIEIKNNVTGHECNVTSVTTITVTTKWVVNHDFKENTNTHPESDDFECIRKCVSELERCGFYYGRLTWLQATKMLKTKEVGTFLVRDSSDPDFLFALSVQTVRGPTSVRIKYFNGSYAFDAEDLIAGAMPHFDGILKLIEYYVRRSSEEAASANDPRHTFLDDSGRRDRAIIMKRPLYNQVRSLQHLCRVEVNKCLPIQRVQLPSTIQNYLQEYPYTK